MGPVTRGVAVFTAVGVGIGVLFAAFVAFGLLPFDSGASGELADGYWVDVALALPARLPPIVILLGAVFGAIAGLRADDFDWAMSAGVNVGIVGGGLCYLLAVAIPAVAVDFEAGDEALGVDPVTTVMHAAAIGVVTGTVAAVVAVLVYRDGQE